MLFSQLQRLCAVASISIGVAACFHSPARIRPNRHINYWEALAELHPDEAIESARTPSEKDFAQALQNLMDGEIDKAEEGFFSDMLSRVESELSISRKLSGR